MHKYLTSGLLLSAPMFVFAQNQIVDSNLGDFIRDIQGFINELLIPLVFAVALIVFLYGVYRYFIQGKGSETEREEGKKYILWAIIGFVIMVSIWGIVALLASAIPASGPLEPPQF